jgi:aromatic-amino-acid transaminase
MADVMTNAKLKESIDKERYFYIDLISRRATLFLDEADKVGLPVLPYKSGFFVTVPTNTASKISYELKQQDIFILPLEKGLRIAICAIPTFQLHGLAGKINEVLNNCY